MQIGIITQGSNGDVEMLISLALEFIKNNHEVEIFIVTINDRDYSFLNEYPGLKVHQKHIRTEFRSRVDELEFWNLPEDRNDTIFQILHARVKRYFIDYSKRFAAEKDLVMGSQHIYELACFAEKFNKPYISINFPMEKIRTRYGPPFSFSNLKDPDIERLWDSYESHHNDFLIRTINDFRKRQELPPVKNVLQDIYISKFLNLIPYSKYLANPKPDWDPSFHLCGFLKSADHYNDWQPSQDLIGFMQQGEKPVFMTVGSMAEHENDICNLQNILLASAHLIQRKVIILSEWENGNSIEGNVYKLKGFVSYPKILSYCSLVVHHGGIGTAHNAAEAGCPSIIITYGFDQPYNAKMLSEVGLSNGSIKRKGITAEALAQLITNALEDKTMKQKAEEMAILIKSENAVSDTVKLIETKMEQYKIKKPEVRRLESEVK